MLDAFCLLSYLSNRSDCSINFFICCAALVRDKLANVSRATTTIQQGASLYIQIVVIMRNSLRVGGIANSIIGRISTLCAKSGQFKNAQEPVINSARFMP